MTPSLKSPKGSEKYKYDYTSENFVHQRAVSQIDRKQWGTKRDLDRFYVNTVLQDQTALEGGKSKYSLLVLRHTLIDMHYLLDVHRSAVHKFPSSTYQQSTYLPTKYVRTYVRTHVHEFEFEFEYTCIDIYKYTILLNPPQITGNSK